MARISWAVSTKRIRPHSPSYAARRGARSRCVGGGAVSEQVSLPYYIGHIKPTRAAVDRRCSLRIAVVHSVSTSSGAAQPDSRQPARLEFTDIAASSTFAPRCVSNGAATVQRSEIRVQNLGAAMGDGIHCRFVLGITPYYPGPSWATGHQIVPVAKISANVSRLCTPPSTRHSCCQMLNCQSNVSEATG
ncbi:hypothetical protein FKP32DRAFT_1168579 [Trametes sanguinea]|nr:hypothetical protein FKP32DRAFT_1168579 [Trametes sanguinea]